ncbi:MAG: hypothetical protein ACLGH7_11910, partial [Actinomycetes bacterium]
MEAIGEDLGKAFGGDYDAGGWLLRPARLRTVPDEPPVPVERPAAGERPVPVEPADRDELPVPVEGQVRRRVAVEELSQPPAAGPGRWDVLDGVAGQLAAAALSAPGLLATATHVEAADFADRVEGLAR